MNAPGSDFMRLPSHPSEDVPLRAQDGSGGPNVDPSDAHPHSEAEPFPNALPAENISGSPRAAEPVPVKGFVTKRRIVGCLIGLAAGAILMLVGLVVGPIIGSTWFWCLAVIVGIALMATHRHWYPGVSGVVRANLSVATREFRNLDADWGAAAICLMLMMVVSLSFRPASSSRGGISFQHGPQLSNGSSLSAPVGVRSADYGLRIEQVLAADARVGDGATSYGQIVSRMRSIGLEGCPVEFQEAYLTHIHAWEALVELERRAVRVKEQANSDEAMVESFFRGLLGDPLGKMNEHNKEVDRIKTEHESVLLNIKQTADVLERIAIRHGARMPGRNPTPGN